MAELHSALKYLGPAEWSDIPQEGTELESYLSDLLEHAQLILDSVPFPAPGDAPKPPQAQSHDRATKASEVSLSSERSATPPFDHEKFRKEWGKQQKINVKENPLGVSVYKMSSKDGKGSWFARSSVHEGIGFSKFKKSLQMEFEKSLAEQGPPGTGNVRGIGGEERVEQIKTGKAKVEVYRLSAQFPGPTAARDFVTMLVTSDKAVRTENTSQADLGPRHYMVISRPCNHPKTQPQTGFVRGFYESIEFIREVPRKLQATQSSLDLNHAPQSGAAGGRPRSSTGVDQHTKSPNPADPEDNPVEWMMITRSDPGGGIPRFLVERGTPGSICTDAAKFMDWACQNDDEDIEKEPATDGQRPSVVRKQSVQSWRGRGLVGVEESQQEKLPEVAETSQAPTTEETQAPGLFGALRSYAPQAVLDRLPAATSSAEPNGAHEKVAGSPQALPAERSQEDARSMSVTSFASAEEHWSSEAEDEEASITSGVSATGVTDSKEKLHREKELRKLDERKQALHKKFADIQTKHGESQSKEAEAVTQENTKAAEKHKKELQKHEEKYKKELEKIEQKQEKERQKVAEKMKKAQDKDEKSRLTRERDEARQELDLLKKEADSLRHIVSDLQKENTALVIKLGKAGIQPDAIKDGSRSRSSSSLSRKLENVVKDSKDKSLAAASAAASMKSNHS